MRVLAIATLLAGCSNEHFPFPDMQQIVNDSLPSALKPGATTPMARLAPADDTKSTLDMLAQKSIRNMFQDHYLDGELGGPGQGGLVAGYLNAQISNIHSRMRGLDKLGGSGDCMGNAPVAFTADLSAAIDPTMTIALPNLQCSIPFQGAGEGGGAVVGTDGAGNTSLWVSVGAIAGGDDSFTSAGGTVTYANVLNEGSTDPAAPESVDGMVAVYFSQNTFGSALRFKANATASKFEMFYASNGGSIKGIGADDGEVWLGGGFRMVSDATRIYADGVIYNFDNPSALWQPFTTCIDASTLTTTPAVTDCDALATTFTLGASPSLSYCEIVGAGSGCTIPAPMFVNAPMASTVISAIAAIFPISAAPAGVSDF